MKWYRIGIKIFLLKAWSSLGFPSFGSLRLALDFFRNFSCRYDKSVWHLTLYWSNICSVFYGQILLHKTRALDPQFFFRGKRKKLFFVRSYLPSIVSESKPIPLWKTNMCLKAKKGLDLSKIVYWITEKWAEMDGPTNLFTICALPNKKSH